LSSNLKDFGKQFESNGNISKLDNIFTNHVLDSLESTHNGMYKSIALKKYKTNTIDNIRARTGQVLKVDTIKAGDIEAKNSFDLQFIKELTPDSLITTYKVRVPTIDGILPKIDSSMSEDKKNIIIDLYEVYTPESVDDKHKVNDYVEVKFDNYLTLEGGKIISQPLEVSVPDPQSDPSSSGLDYSRPANGDSVLSNLNSAAGYTKENSIHVGVGTSYPTISKIPADKKYITADITAHVDRFNGRNGKTRKLVFVRLLKEHCLGDIYLCPQARDQFTEMSNAYNKYITNNGAKSKDSSSLYLKATEALRTLQDQIDIFNSRYSPSYEELIAKGLNRSSAKNTRPDLGPAAWPGTSNHESGLAVDINFTKSSLENGYWVNKSKQDHPGKGFGVVYDWLESNAYKYGFRRTVESESWHWEFRSQWIGIKPNGINSSDQSAINSDATKEA